MKENILIAINLLPMKKFLFPILIGTIIFIQSCVPGYYPTTSDPAERFIKNQIESHDPGGFSSVKIFSLYSVVPYNVAGTMSFTGYKYGTEKGLLIAVMPPAPVGAGAAKPNLDSNMVVMLTVAQVQSIIDNYKILQQNLMKEKAIPNEAIYQDYTVTPDLFISYRGTPYYSKTAPTPISIDLWIHTQKFTLASTTDLITHLQTFISY